MKKWFVQSTNKKIKKKQWNIRVLEMSRKEKYFKKFYISNFINEKEKKTTTPKEMWIGWIMSRLFYGLNEVAK